MTINENGGCDDCDATVADLMRQRDAALSELAECYRQLRRAKHTCKTLRADMRAIERYHTSEDIVFENWLLSARATAERYYQLWQEIACDGPQPPLQWPYGYPAKERTKDLGHWGRSSPSSKISETKQTCVADFSESDKVNG